MKVLVATTCLPDDRKTLAIVRALGRVGATVDVAGDRLLGQAFHSKYVRSRLCCPHPGRDMGGFIEWLIDRLGHGSYDVALPTSDATTIALTRHRDELTPLVHLALPSSGDHALACDKLALVERARALGIPVPTTHCPADEAELLSLADRIRYPCVVKLRRGSGGIGLRFADGPDELIDHYRGVLGEDDLVLDRSRPLIQSFVPGEVHDVCVLACHGSVRAAVTQRRLRTYPHDGGVGVIVETTDEPVLRDQATTLIEALGWHGPAQVEFKVDPRDGAGYLMEINARFWGTVDLAVEAGVNLPWLTAKLAIEGDVEPAVDYAVGLRYRWPFPYALLAAMESGRVAASLREFLWPGARTRSDLRVSDPLPLLAEGAFLVRRLFAERRLRPLSER